MTLDELPEATLAEIVEVSGDDPLSIRLMEIGFIDGQVVQRTGQAPSGDPIEFSLSGCRVGLRKQEAQRVVVRPKN